MPYREYQCRPVSLSRETNAERCCIPIVDSVLPLNPISSSFPLPQGNHKTPGIALFCFFLHYQHIISASGLRNRRACDKQHVWLDVFVCPAAATQAV
ncbi:uncharacterized protein SETTUDRAFT_162687 [Exserohilum turcica Et28A]|uniref:Uncharacterized protein n=1 Tax=Exserohilum turcicum (strain 28A) TaxID=671987 RepID=R0KX12_EXST2|nr:uncharacterized protein SETTUDRAFT_162687 [Exserohilum turcica Et28A]EOA92242.1 hypothetical protein SETTUDRAFT_162687 [Exserohilum turcica Et28A]